MGQCNSRKIDDESKTMRQQQQALPQPAVPQPAVPQPRSHLPTSGASLKVQYEEIAFAIIDQLGSKGTDSVKLITALKLAQAVVSQFSAEAPMGIGIGKQGILLMASCLSRAGSSQSSSFITSAVPSSH